LERNHSIISMINTYTHLRMVKYWQIKEITD